MAVFHPHTVECACGNTITVQLADSINARRSPETRAAILQGDLHRTVCSRCGRRLTVEKPFYYSDFDRNALFKVLPRGERHTWKKASAEVDRASSFVPSQIAGRRKRTLRVIFGMDELREKLVAQDCGIDDRVLELLKVLVVHEHPILLKWSRLRLTLDKVSDKSFHFGAAYEHNARRFEVKLPRSIADTLGSDEKRMQKWAGEAHKNSVFALPDHWVNMWRWSPQPTALERLKVYAEAARANRPIDTVATEFRGMIGGLPRGSHLPAWAKKDLQSLFDYAKKNNLQQLEDQLFEVRFDIDLEDDWSTNQDMNDIDTLWSLLRDLPDSNVEGNTKIRELLLDVDEGGGTYNPTTNDIAIGSAELSVRERFEDVVRHEVGHSVHEMRADSVNGWLTQKFGWRTFDNSNAGIDQWVQAMGGWGGATPTQQREIRDALKTALGSGASWNPGPTPTLPPGHLWYQANFGPRLAYEKSGGSWFRNFKTWYRAGGKAFFLNYWYRSLCVVDTATLDLVAKMPDSYAAMSHFEFFAELYALYFDLDDPKRAVIPADVMAWLAANIGAPEPGAPMPAAPTARQHWETITRPHRRKKTAARKNAVIRKKSASRKNASVRKKAARRRR